MSVDPTSMAEPSANIQQSPKECISCRITGTLALSGSGAYVLYHNNNLPPTVKASPLGKRVMNVVGTGNDQRRLFVFISCKTHHRSVGSRGHQGDLVVIGINMSSLFEEEIRIFVRGLPRFLGQHSQRLEKIK